MVLHVLATATFPIRKRAVNITCARAAHRRHTTVAKVSFGTLICNFAAGLVQLNAKMAIDRGKKSPTLTAVRSLHFKQFLNKFLFIYFVFGFVK